MPPKGKGKGKKKKKGAKGANSGEGEKVHKEKEILTFNEAVLLFQLQAKQKQQEDILNVVEDYKKRIKRQKDRNNILNQEKQKYMKEAIRQAKDQDIKLQQKAEVKYEQVEEALKDKLAAAKSEQEHVKDLKKQITKLEEDISNSLAKVKENEDFKDRARFENQTHITILKKEMKDMKESYEELSEFFVKNLLNIKEQIKKSTKSSIDKEKQIASEQALESLDVSSHQEFSDNKWLRQEVYMHKTHLANISAVVEDLEQKNVEIMGNLLESQFEDVQITRDFFVACDDMNEGAGGVDKSNSLVQHGDGNDADGVIAIHGDVEGDEVDPTGIDWLDNYIPTFDENSSEEIARLAPMDLKFLCISGSKIKIHQNPTKKENEHASNLHYDDSNRKMEWLTKDVMKGHKTEM